jgi:hypothetical protein
MTIPKILSNRQTSAWRQHGLDVYHEWKSKLLFTWTLVGYKQEYYFPCSQSHEHGVWTVWCNYDVSHPVGNRIRFAGICLCLKSYPLGSHNKFCSHIHLQHPKLISPMAMQIKLLGVDTWIQHAFPLNAVRKRWYADRVLNVRIRRMHQ